MVSLSNPQESLVEGLAGEEQIPDRGKGRLTPLPPNHAGGFYGVPLHRFIRHFQRTR
jgi:hypothetical protein